MTPERKKLIERVQKLLALSESPNQHEAELAAARASELMEKYQIDMAEAALTDAKKLDVEVEYYDVPGLRMKYAWVVNLTWAAARLFDCEIMDPRTLHRTQVMIIGYRDDIELAKSVFEYLYNSWNRIVLRDLGRAKAEVAVFGRRFTPKNTMDYKLGHGTGFANALFNRANELARKRHQDVAAASETGTALVAVKDTGVKDKLVDLGAKNFSRKVSRGDSGGRNDGAVAGRSIALGGEIAGGNVGRLT